LNTFIKSIDPAYVTTQWLSRLIAQQPRAREINARVLIVNPYGDPHLFSRSRMGKVLIWGLKRKGIDWVLRNPVHRRFNPDRFDAVLCWPYGFRENPGFLRNCAEFERRVLDTGIPVLNSLAGCDFRHSSCLRLWKAHGIQCPSYQFVRGWADIRLDYPLILRTDKLHLGLNMYLARDLTEAKWIFRQPVAPPLDVAIEFVDTKGNGQYYKKWRSHVIGDAVIPRQAQLCRTWKVNLDAAECCAEALEADRNFISEGEPQAELVACAAKALNADIIALDYAKKADGSYLFWEGNRNFDLSVAGHMWSQFCSTTGRSNEECIEGVKAIADAIASLIIQRIQ
jgi:hypothetical protein